MQQHSQSATVLHIYTTTTTATSIIIVLCQYYEDIGTTTVKIPQGLWNAHENRDAGVFYVQDPIQSYAETSGCHGFAISIY